MTTEIRAVTHRLLVLAVAGAWLTSGIAYGQGQAFGRVSGSVEELYDSNVFAAPENSATTQPVSDWITYLGPMFEAGYNSQPLRLLARYGFTAEKHRTLVDLDEFFARQEAGSTLTYQGRTFSVDLRGGYVNTRTPTELNLETLQFVGRSRAQRVDSSEAFVFNLSAVTNLKLDHEFRWDTLEGAFTTNGHGVRVGVERKTNERTSVRADYRAGLIGFSHGGEERSHVGTVGLVHAFGPALGVEFDGGVRSTSGEIDPELSAVMRHRLERGAISVRYLRTRDTPIGEGASLEIRRISAEVTYTPTRAIAFTFSPVRASSGGTLSRDVVYFLDMRTRIRATRRWSILGVGRAGRQDRSFPTAEAINYRTISLSTVVTLGALEREREEPESETP